MSKIDLSGPEREPVSGKNPKQLVLLLHGLGADGNDMIDLAPEFAEVLPDAHFISPNAPFPCDMAPFGFQWFSLMSYTAEKMLEGARTAEPILNDFIDESLKRFGLKDKDCALVGFSQGTMMSLHVSIRREKPLAGVLGYSGALVEPPSLKDEVKTKLPICLIHGAMDPVVPFMAMEKAANALNSVGMDVETHSRPMLPHGIDMDGINIGKKFLKKIFS